MPWKETGAMEEREAFVHAWLSREFTMSELCERFGVSRPTGYKCLRRFQVEGLPGLSDRSRAPHLQANATPAAQVAAIVALKRRHLSWGPLTLRDWLRRERPQEYWPAVSTVGEVLKRHGLVQPRRRRHHTPPHTQPFAAIRTANDVWSADFKGQFALGDAGVCYPLTITDNHSRFLLCCQGLHHPGRALTRACFERAFIDYGLPRAIRTDKGPPFASVALGGLSALSVWLLKLNVLPERIAPGNRSRMDAMSACTAPSKPPPRNRQRAT